MAMFAIVDRDELDAQLTLAPERYHPRGHAAPATVRVRDLATFSSSTERAKSSGSFVCIDTTHAVDGFIAARPLSVIQTLQSGKKRLEPGDVIISRLRPYLRQIAFVDEALAAMFEGAQLCCSTEFYVLRSTSALSLAFLVPFLLGDGVQALLARSQEGGHHPRVPATTLADLAIPDVLIEDRVARSSAFTGVVSAFRSAERARTDLIERSDPS